MWSSPGTQEPGPGAREEALEEALEEGREEEEQVQGGEEQQELGGTKVSK